MFARLRRHILERDDVHPVIFAAATGNAQVLREMVPPPGAPNREARIKALQAANLSFSDVGSTYTATWCATDVAAASNDVAFLAQWVEVVGPLPLSDNFQGALSCFADATVSWMLDNAKSLVPLKPGDKWAAMLSDRTSAKEFLVDLGRTEYSDTLARKPGSAMLRNEEEACRRCFRVLYDRVFSAFPGYPSPQDCIRRPGRTEHEAVAILGVYGPVTTAALKEYGHGPTEANWKPYFRTFLNSWDKPAFQARRFLDLLDEFFRDAPAMQREIACWVRNRALPRWRHPGVYAKFIELGVLRCDAKLLSSCLNVNKAATKYLEDVPFSGLRDMFLSVRLILARLAGSTGGAGAGPCELAALLNEVQRPGSPLHGRRSFVLLLLFYGAGGPNHLLTKVLADAGADRYRGLMDDVLEVAAWKRWIGSGAIGGLPPEVAQEIMFEAWLATVD
ncbi:hypothetical protein DFJ74DRAFT_640696 [Hyaloraphidium curvatum]|nr:hypothetical protein DFJ74DRAFT_640696 [Hyaloraphidium curvatum]